MDPLPTVHHPADAYEPPTSPLSSPPHSLFEFARDDNDEADESNEAEAKAGDTDETDDSSHSHSAPKRQRLTAAQKLEAVLHTLHEVQWTFPQFIQTWVCASGETRVKDIEINHRQYRTTAQRRRILSKVVETLISNGAIQTTCLSEAVIKSIMNELDNLIASGECFGRFTDEDVDTSRIEEVDFEKAGRTIELLAPTWHILLRRLLQNQRSHRGSYSWSSDPSSVKAISKRIFAVTTLVCYSRARKTSNYFPALLGVYLNRTGTKRKVLQTLAELGLCPTYSQVHNLTKKIATTCESSSVGSNASSPTHKQ